MKSFDPIFFLLAVGGTVGMIGLGIAFAQTSALMIIGFAILMFGSIGTGFARKKRLNS
ncbi:DUF5325 family protein [Paenalkalicoccus suaedae]|uniref:DUF5325 family protein n=1 Tax=Paenalkalicoccus suaedae TaxID=2592382 RepID=A0A859FG13_9BACI|nr:DUF5325 family protein [Paenalkalicoccus suaedae]QKS71564.1 DUF5325 family protein [Paenalkalicoccus suaedae]